MQANRSSSFEVNQLFSSPANVAINPELSESQVISQRGNQLTVVWSDSSPGNSEILFRLVSLDVPTITIETISEPHAKWGSSIDIVGIASNSGTDTVRVDWGDGSEDSDIEVVDNSWMASHTYESTGVGDRVVIAKLIRSDGTQDAVSNPVEINVAKRATLLDLLHAGSAIQGSNVTVLGEIVDEETGIGIGSVELTFSGDGASNLQPTPSSLDGSFQSSGASPDSVGTQWTVQAHFIGSSEYEASNSNILTYDTVSSSTSQFDVAVGSPSVVTLTGFNASVEFDNVISGGNLFVAVCGEEPENERFLSMGLCLEISSSAVLERESGAHVRISFDDKEIPDGHIVSEIDIFHQTVTGPVDITESRDEASRDVTGFTSSFSKFIVGVAIHDPQPVGAVRQQIFVGSDQRVVFYPEIERTIQFDAATYDIGSSANLTIEDANANLDWLRIDTIIAEISSSSDPDGIIITLTEIDTDSGIFSGSFVLNDGSSWWI